MCVTNAYQGRKAASEGQLLLWDFLVKVSPEIAPDQRESSQCGEPRLDFVWVPPASVRRTFASSTDNLLRI